jgi:hypothetical protein
LRKLRRFLEPLRREILSELAGDPETLLVDSRLLSVLHPCSGFSEQPRLVWGSVGEVGFLQRLRGEGTPHLCHQRGPSLLRADPRKNVAGVSLSEELIDQAALGEGSSQTLGDLAYRSKELREALGEVGILLSTQPSERRCGLRQRIEIAISSLKRVFGLDQTLATTLVGLATRILRPRSAPTPTPSWSTGFWDALKVTSRSSVGMNLTTHI